MILAKQTLLIYYHFLTNLELRIPTVNAVMSCIIQITNVSSVLTLSKKNIHTFKYFQ